VQTAFVFSLRSLHSQLPTAQGAQNKKQCTTLQQPLKKNWNLGLGSEVGNHFVVWRVVRCFQPSPPFLSLRHVLQSVSYLGSQQHAHNEITHTKHLGLKNACAKTYSID
jgi:hypothetical protein